MKEFITKDNRIIRSNTTVHLTEAPPVELSGKGTEFGGLEVLREDFSCKLVGVTYDKGLSIWQPRAAKSVGGMLVGKLHQIHELDIENAW